MAPVKITEKNKNLKIEDLVYSVVRNIPKGRVNTYGGIAKALNFNNLNSKISPRHIGYLLHKNTNPKQVPCHRVVNVKGILADNYKFGGWKEQRKKLMSEGVEFKSEKRVDIKKSIQ